MRNGLFIGISALIAVALVFTTLLFVSGMLYSTQGSLEPGYVIDVGEGNSTAGAEEENLSFEEALRSANPSSGQAVFKKCAACHSLIEGDHGVGPSLHRILGNDIASASGYPYSDALKALEGDWGFEALNGYLENPSRFAPGTAMSFSGLRKLDDRASLILFLLQGGVAQSIGGGNGAGAGQGTGAGQGNAGIGSGEPTNAQEPIVDLLKEQLKSADLAFNRPEVMQLGQATSVELVVSPKTADRAPVPEDTTTQQAAEAIGLSSDLPGETQFVENVQYAMQMEAEISGLGFDVQPPGPQRQTILPGRSAKWVWTVQPKAAGAGQVFTVNVDAIIQRDGSDLPPIRITTFTERVTVEVSFWQNITQYAKDLTALNAALVGIGGTLIAVIGWLWARLRKRKKKADPKPTEVIVTHRIEDEK